MSKGRSVARVYPNANDKFGRAWWDYGECSQYGPEWCSQIGS